MTAETWQILGFGLTLLAAIGGVVARDRALQNLIVEGDKATRVEAKAEADRLHERVNKVRDEFVRREDLDAHLSRIEKSIERVYDAQKEQVEQARDTNQRVDAILQHLVHSGNGTKR